MRVWIAVSEARLILTCGLPGAGKTTLARQLAADRSALRLTKDEWMWALGSSPWEAPTEPAAKDSSSAKQHPPIMRPGLVPVCRPIRSARHRFARSGVSRPS